MSTIDRRDVTVTYDARHGYIASAPELRQPIVAFSLGGLRRRVEALMLSDDVALCSSMVSPSASATAARRRRSWRAEPSIRACKKMAKGDSDLINVCFGPLC